MKVPVPSRVALLGLVVVALAAPAALRAESHTEAMPAGVKGEMLTWIKDAEGKLVQLAEAMPEGKYSWRPGKDVRTVGEVYMHVATANYGLPQMMGVAAPEGFSFDTYEKSLTKKADIQKTLKESFAHMEKTLMGMTDADMEQPIDIFGMKTTRRGGFMLLLSHAHEHLGQSIAYARSNNVTPPWTAKQQAAMKEQAEKNKTKK